MITIYRDVLSVKEPHYIEIKDAFDRIKNGKSRIQVEAIRAEPDADKRNALKQKLPCVIFAGEFTQRTDKCLVKHSGYCILDFDHVANVDALKQELFKETFILAVWRSPSGDGVKALARLKFPEKHRQQYKALLEHFKNKGINTDEKNINESRVTYESEDQDIMIKPYDVLYFEGIVEQKAYVNITNTAPRTQQETDDYEIYKNLKRWMEKHGEFFVEGNRNNFLMKFAAALNRYGVSDTSAYNFLSQDFLNGSTFPTKELEQVIKSIYNRYSSQHGNEHFDKKGEMVVQPGKKAEDVFEVDMKIKDLIYFSDCWDAMEYRLQHGTPHGETTYFKKLDEHWRWMRREVNVLHGFGNLGKSSVLNQLTVVKSVFDKTKWAVFCPENSPADFYYQDLAETFAGKLFNRYYPGHATEEERDKAKKFVNEHFFYIYPKDDAPTPEYMLKRFMEVIIKHKVDGIIIDPFNQLSHNRANRDDLYLESFLSTFTRFVQNNDLYSMIVTHPNKPQKNGTNKVYSEPDVYDLAGGAMWNNKAYNILCYHRPNFYLDPKDPYCTLTSQKIKRQKLNGIPGKVDFKYVRETSRFMELENEDTSEFGYNPLTELVKDMKTVEFETREPERESDDEMPF